MENPGKIYHTSEGPLPAQDLNDLNERMSRLTAELSSKLRNTEEHPRDFSREQYQDALRLVWEGWGSDDASIIYGALRAPNLTFNEKHAIVAEIFRNLSGIEPSDGMDSLIQMHLPYVLEEYEKNEKNFFLKNLAHTYLLEEYPHYSIGEKKRWVQNAWEHGDFYERDDGTTTVYFEMTGERVSFGRKINSIGDLTDTEVSEIAENILKEDRLFASPNKESDYLLEERYRDDDISKSFLPATVLPKKEFFDLAAVPARNFVIYSEEKRINETIISRLGARTGGVYESGTLVSVFDLQREDGKVPQSDRIGYDALRSVVSLVGAVDQMASYGADPDYAGVVASEVKHLQNILPYTLYVLLSDLAGSAAFYDADEGADNRSNAITEVRNALLSFLRNEMNNTGADKALPVSEFISRNRVADADDFARHYTSMMSLRMRSFLEDYFQIEFSVIPLYAQMHFLKFISEESEEKIKNVKKFIQAGTKDSIKNRLTSFLSLGSGFDGDNLLNFDELLGKEKSDYVFTKYAEIVNASEDVVSYIEEYFGKDKKEGLTPETVNEIREKMLVRGKDLLVRFAERIEKGEEIDTAFLLKELEDARFSNTAFLFSLKTLNESRTPVRLEDIRSVSTRVEKAVDISDTDKEEMKRIYAENYRKKPKKQRRLLDILEKSFADDANSFYVVRHEGKMLGFYRVEDRGGKKHYAGSFNIDPQYQGVGLGQMILEQSLYERINHGEEIFEADCALFDGVAFEYIENGFIGMSTKKVDEDISLNIHVNAKLNNAGIFETKTMPTQEIVKSARPGETISLSGGRILIAAESFLSRKSLPMEHVGEAHDNGRYVLTRYFHTEDELGKRTTYAVFELVAGDILAEYQGETESENERKAA